MTGTVQFRVDGHDIGDPQPVRDGHATYTAPTSAVLGKDITAVYSGDADYIVLPRMSLAGKARTSHYALTIKG